MLIMRFGGEGRAGSRILMATGTKGSIAIRRRGLGVLGSSWIRARYAEW